MLMTTVAENVAKIFWQSMHALYNSIYFYPIAGLLLIVLMVIIRKLDHYLIWRAFKEGKYQINRHQWRPTTFTGPRWCNICESVVYGIRSHVVKCDICGMFAHARCASQRVNERRYPCRIVALRPHERPSKPLHHWVKGNIDPTDTCEVCGLFCGSILALSGIHCSWCRRRMHETCFKENCKELGMKYCDLGWHHELILSPMDVVMKKSERQPSTPRQALQKVHQAAVNSMLRLRRKSQSHRPSDEDPATDTQEEDGDLPFKVNPSMDSSPLLVFVNSRSGGQMGIHILRRFRSWLNPLQVYDLAEGGPTEALRIFRHVSRLRILVCGGDGTVGWILSALDDVGFERQPPVAILPLGTGNDLARVLGWGGGYSTKRMRELLSELLRAHVGLLDRWLVDLNGKKYTVMNNYLGVGVDAQVALEFHQQRERVPSLFMSQFVNKLWYGRFGAKNALLRTCTGLKNKIILECDGRVVAPPENAEGIILLNINSYGGGSTLWYEGPDEYPSSGSEDEENIMDDDISKVTLGPSSLQDGLIDVVAVYGSFHLGQLQVGLSQAVRVCQCRKVKITLKERLPVQVDGEPGMQNPCTLEVRFLKQSLMLCRTREEKDIVTSKVNEVLDWAERTDVITSEQRDVLLKEIARRVKEKPAPYNDHTGLAMLH